MGSVGPLTVAPTTVSIGTGFAPATLSTFTRGEKSYELSNHLGNILTTITDKKIAVPSTSNSSLIDHFTADIATAQDYYPFGMLMPGRTYTASTATNYRYGFNGKENDNEVKGVGNEIDYGMRYYDPRAGRFMSVDPVFMHFPWNSPYSYAENEPTNFIDLDGSEKASPRSVEAAQYLIDVIGHEITNSNNFLAVENNETIKQQLQKAIEIDRKTYGALAVFVYKNQMSNRDQLLDHLIDAVPAMNEALDLSPAGDVKVVFTGANFKGEPKSRVGAVGFLALDLFGGEMLSALGKGARIARGLSGPGKEILESVIAKTGRIAQALDETHIRAAVNDIRGNPVVIGGRVFDHLQEVRNSLEGLGNQIGRLNKLIDEGKASKEVIGAASELRSKLQIQKDAINDVLNRASNELKK